MNSAPSSNQADVAFGPLVVALVNDKALVQFPKWLGTAPRIWPLEFEMDVAEAFDDLISKHPTHEISLKGWPKDLAFCPFVRAKLEMLAIIWHKFGKYPKF